MIYLIYPVDPSISFLDKILERFSDSIEHGSVQLIRCEASDESYAIAKDTINEIPENSKIIFMGHGIPSAIYGGASELYERKFLISLREMNTFKNKTLVLMSCYSGKLLLSSRKDRNFSSSLGFGLLPSELLETKGKSKFEKLNLIESDIEDYQSCLVEMFCKLTDLLLNTTQTTEQIADKLKLFINTKINTCIFELDNRKLANLLYFTHEDMHHD